MSLVEQVSPLLSPGAHFNQRACYSPAYTTELSPSSRPPLSPALSGSPKQLLYNKHDEFLKQYHRRSKGTSFRRSLATKVLSEYKDDAFYDKYLKYKLTPRAHEPSSRLVDRRIHSNLREIVIKSVEDEEYSTDIAMEDDDDDEDESSDDEDSDEDEDEENQEDEEEIHEQDHEQTKPIPGAKKKLTSESIETTSIRLPSDFTQCPMEHLITLISRMLKQLITLNDSSVPREISHPENQGRSSKAVLTRYHSRTPPGISVSTYLSRLTQFNNLTSTSLLTTVYYIDLLSHHFQPYFTLNSWTVHRFLLVGTMISQKSMEDFFYTNEHYAKVGGVAISELNCLELDFLSRVDWRCIPAKQVDGKHQIKYAKDVLDVYYGQLIQLMGKGGSIVFQSEEDRKRKFFEEAQVSSEKSRL